MGMKVASCLLAGFTLLLSFRCAAVAAPPAFSDTSSFAEIDAKIDAEINSDGGQLLREPQIPSTVTSLPRATTQEALVNPTGLTQPAAYGWHTDSIGSWRGDFDVSFGVKFWPDRFDLRNLIFGGTLELLPGLRARLQLRREDGEQRAFEVETDEDYLEAYNQYRGHIFNAGGDLRVGHVRYLHFPYPDAIALFDQVPGISDLTSPTQSDYRTVILQGEAALNSGWGAHWTGRAISFQQPQYPAADVIEAYAFYRSDFGRGWHAESRIGDLAVRNVPLGRAGQPGVDLYLGKQLGEFNVGLLYENKRTEHDYTGIAVQFRPGPVTKALGRYSADYSRHPEGFTVQIPLLHERLNESRFVRSGDILVGEVRAVRIRTLWVQGTIRNQYEHRLESWGDTIDPHLHCVVTEEPWYLQTEALVSPHVLPDNRWLTDREGPGQFVQRVTYRYYRAKDKGKREEETARNSARLPSSPATVVPDWVL
jgi:hypothetical protein